MILTIFGYTKTGKTMLFNLLADKKEEISKFSASTNEFHKAIVNVPDDRLKQLADLFKTPPVYAKIEYLDVGAISFGEAKDTTFIDLLRRGDGLIHIVRGFEDCEILHPKETIDPLRDIDNIEDELRTVDFLSIEKRIEKLKNDMKKIKSKVMQDEFDIFSKMKDFIESGKSLRNMSFTVQEETIIRGFKLLSLKPIITIINTDENNFKKYSMLNKKRDGNSLTLVFCGKIETELLELEEEEREMFKNEYGLSEYEYIKSNFIRASYDLMGLISFFTVGEDETRAWTIEKDSTALIAAGKIHSDIQQGFIRAEIIAWDEFLSSGSFSFAKEKGLLRLEGKEYIVKDGEIAHFRFNK
jgi:GTP-binding protein YchF